ncbi:hypothetical protein CO611_00845 [Lysobacteraceae bacterium NML03-0222]|nr:hypothetical protein CO611_00845 [Xanthomonadaceae bacterium NML03-0222]
MAAVRRHFCPIFPTHGISRIWCWRAWRSGQAAAIRHNLPMFARMLLVWLVVMNLGVLAWWALHRPLLAESGAQVDPSIPRLELLQASGDIARAQPQVPGQAQLQALQPQVDVTASTAQGESSVCASFGPFAEASQANAAAASLRGIGAKVKLRQAPGSHRGYNVQLPPLASAAEANAMAARLRAAGFNDLVVIKQGEQQNGIALGRFGSEENARRHQTALRAKGFRAQLLPNTSGSRFWLDAEAPAGFNAAAQRRAINAPGVQNIRCS